MVVDFADVQTHEHLCLIYETKEEQASAFVPFVQSGLVQNQKCFYLTDESSPEWVISKLRANDFPIDEYIQRGAFVVMHTRDAYLRDGSFDIDKIMGFWEDRLAQAKELGFNAVRATAEMSWALSNFPGCEKFVEYESYLNSVFPSVDFTGLCQYNRKRFDAKLVKEMLHVHPLVCVGKLLLENPGYINHDKYVKFNAEMEVQSLVDNLVMTRRLAEANAELHTALAEKDRAAIVLEERQQECEALYQELLSLARVVSHEMQAPLSVMQSYLRLLSTRYKGRLGNDADEFMEKSIKASRIVVRMIDDLWNYARIDMPSEVVREDVCVMTVICEALRELDSLIAATGATIDQQAEFPRLNVSRRHIRFLFKALIENAIKYAPPGQTPDIFVSLNQTSTEYVFAVRDNGRGIDTIHSQDVFKLFCRLGSQPCEDGTGMGLAICKRIVQHYQGDIWFESEMDNGSTFYFSFPKSELNV